MKLKGKNGGSKQTSGQEDNGSYDVGYGKTPEHSRFKPGQSGNPRGRPVGSKNRLPPAAKDNRFRSIIAAESDRLISIQDSNGKIGKITTARAVVRAIAYKAVKQVPRCMRLWTELARENERIETAEREEHFKKWAQYVEDNSNNSSFERSTRFPDPRDIILDVVRGSVTFAGPMLRQEIPSWRRWRAIRARVAEEIEDIRGIDQTDMGEHRDLFAGLLSDGAEALCGIDTALGGDRHIMAFLERVDVSEIEPRCHKKRRRGTLPILPFIIVAIIKQGQKEEREFKSGRSADRFARY